MTCYFSFSCRLALTLFFFSPLVAKKEEDEDDMEDLQRWAMEAM